MAVEPLIGGTSFVPAIEKHSMRRKWEMGGLSDTLLEKLACSIWNEPDFGGMT